MIKLFGIRISPFFLIILGLECLTLLLSVYIGILLYHNNPEFVSTETVDRTVPMGLFLFLMLGILTPGFFSQLKIIHNLKKPVSDMVFGLGVGLLTMIAIIFSNYSNLNSRTVFIAVLLSASIGLISAKVTALGKYWRFLVRSGVN